MKPAALILLSGLLATGAGARDKTPVAIPAGAPVSCIPLVGIDHTRVRDDSTIDFFMRGRTVYRNTLPNSCPELGFEQAFSYKTSLSQLCNVDIISVLRQSSPLQRGASCGLGQFQPVTLADPHAN